MPSSSSGGGDYTVRYAPYLEYAHSSLIDHGGQTVANMDAFNIFDSTLHMSPYGSIDSTDISGAYFGVHTDDPSVTYEIENFPSLWDMFGKFMAGLDLHDLWSDVYEDVVHGPEIADAVSAHGVILSDEIMTTVAPKFLAGMRDINSVQASTFVIGQAIIADSFTKSVSKFAGDLKIHAIDISNQQWAKHLDWNSGVIRTYSEMFKLYYSNSMDINRDNMEWRAKDAMWNFNLLDGMRAFLGALNGAAASQHSNNDPNKASGILGGALTGAAAGAQIGGGPGALVGGILGLGLGFL